MLIILILSYAYPILKIRPLNLLQIKKKQQLHMCDPPLAGAASISFQYGEFVNKANVILYIYLLLLLYHYTVTLNGSLRGITDHVFLMRNAHSFAK